MSRFGKGIEPASVVVRILVLSCGIVASLGAVNVVGADVMCLGPSGSITIRTDNVCHANEIVVDPAAVSATVALQIEQLDALQTQTATLQQQASDQATQITVLQGEKTQLQAQVVALQADSLQQATALQAVEDQVSTSTPVGTILDFGGATAPAGYVLCNGDAVSRTDYAELFAVIGTNFGEGDGSTTFNVPDLRGRFTRGWDMGAFHDPDAAFRGPIALGGAVGDNIGSYQPDRLAAHTHRQTICSAPGGTPFGMAGISCDGEQISRFFSGIAGGSETRPRNVAVNKIIKF